MALIYHRSGLGIDFILTAPLVHAGTHRAGPVSRDPYPCMECGVKTTDTAFGAVQEPVEESGATYSPGDFLRQFGAVIAICLGLALLAQVLVAIVGHY